MAQETIPPELIGSPAGELLAAIGGIHDRIEAAQSAFRAKAAESGAALGCPEGCGSCCENFVPDVLPVEALAAAAFILGHRPDLAGRAAQSQGPTCPFYDADRPEAHCSIYPGRPLVCRLFGFAAVLGKDGEPSFALCRHMPSPVGNGERAWSDEALRGLFGAVPPVMAAFGAELLGLEPDAAGERRPLPEALPAAIARLGLALRYASLGRGDDGDEPEPNAPSPRAA
ncbi:MAG: YkgJ family cysteine cluster protein [Spirochaetaceae bacterium]|nr:YkgJ family cysteine cluster protein [Spirochaetaceae bacterium]